MTAPTAITPGMKSMIMMDVLVVGMAAAEGIMVLVVGVAVMAMLETVG
jgi:hypothetical protein